LKKTALLLPLLLLAACSTEDDALPRVDTLAAPADYIVSNKGALNKDFASTVAKNGDTLKRFFPEAGFAVVTTANPDAYKGVASTLVRDITIDWVEPVETVRFEGDANPPSSGDNNPLFDLLWGLDAVDAPEAWNAGSRGAGVRVAVLDSGIDADHPDLEANLNKTLSISFVEGEGYAIDLPPGAFNHGTHVAGTVAALDNDIGVVGVAPDAEIVAVKVLSEKTGGGSFAGVISGIVYAADIDSDIINMSLGGTLPKNGYTYKDANGNTVKVGANEVADLLTALSRATNYAYQQGTTVIASAGNNARNAEQDKATVSVPGASTNVLTISATGPEGWALDSGTDLDTPAFYTNYGQSLIDFAAPGGDVDFDLRASGRECTIATMTAPCWRFDLVLSTINGSYGWAAGTSMAAPHASGIAALIIAENGGDMKPAQVAQVLRERADDLGKPGKDDFYGLGRVSSGY
jgi:lantibiotic leader peptide-processing serine protease